MELIKDTYIIPYKRKIDIGQKMISESWLMWTVVDNSELYIWIECLVPVMKNELNLSIRLIPWKWQKINIEEHRKMVEDFNKRHP